MPMMSPTRAVPTFESHQKVARGWERRSQLRMLRFYGLTLCVELEERHSGSFDIVVSGWHDSDD
jgi:hypothetical protein